MKIYGQLKVIKQAINLKNESLMELSDEEATNQSKIGENDDLSKLIPGLP
jgi:hypothetical protein